MGMVRTCLFNWAYARHTGGTFVFRIEDTDAARDSEESFDAIIDSLTWLAWHAAREIDLQVSALAGTDALWTSAGFSRRFALPLPDDTEDWHHTPEQAAQVVVSDLSLLFSYLDEAYALATTYLRSLTPEGLDDIVDDSWDPPVTRGVRLASVIDDAAQHSGQAVYSRRLLGLEG